MQVCVATSLATIIVTSLRSVLAHHRRGAVDWGILKTWAPGIVVGAALGVLVASGLRTVVLQGIWSFGDHNRPLYGLGPSGLASWYGNAGWH